MDELSKTFAGMHKKYRVSLFVMLIAIAGGVIAAITAGAVCLPFFAIAVAAGVLLVTTQKKFKEFYVENIIGACLGECAFIDGISYDAQNGIPASAVAATEMIKTGDSISTEDLVTGVYNGTEFAQSTVKITHTTGTGNDKHTSELFGGLWLSFDLGRRACCDMQIVSEKFRADTHKNGLTKIDKGLLPASVFDGVSFADAFTVYASDTEAARACIASLSSALLKLLSINKRPVMLMVIGSTVHLAMFSSETPFEPSLRKGADINSEKERFKTSLRTVTDFMDAAVSSTL